MVLMKKKKTETLLKVNLFFEILFLLFCTLKAADKFNMFACSADLLYTQTFRVKL